MSTNKKITQLDELTSINWADDDVIAIVDISAQETKKIQLSTFRTAVTGVSTLNASTPLTVDTSTGDVTISVAISGGGTVNAVLDEDNMASDSATALSTQQSIKAYVDSQVGTVDTLAEILANGNTSGGTDIAVSTGDSITTDTIAETTTAAGVTIDGVLVKDGQVDGRDVSVDGTKLDTVETNADVTDTTNVTAAGALMDSELTNIAAVKALDQGVATTDTPTFAGLTATTADINGGTIDGTVIGGSSAAAGTFTTFTSTGIDDNASSTAVTIDSSGNVGIGTTPSYRLHISNGSSTGTAMQLETTGSGHNFDMVDGTGTARFRNIAGSLSLYGDVNSSYLGSIIFLPQGTTERMRIDSSGNVGIGVSTIDTALGTKLHVAGTIRTDTGSANANPAIVFDHDNFADADANYIMLDRTSEAMRFTVNASERMRIDSSGNVGIGTSAPDSGTPLHVAESSASLGANPTASAFLVERAGNVGMTLGTANTGLCSIFMGDTDSLTVGRIQYDNSDNSLQFWANSIERMRIDSSGNVGIGTSSPSSLLHLASTGSAVLTLEADTDNATETDVAKIELSQDGGLTLGRLGFNSGNQIDIWNEANEEVRFGTNNSESMRIDSSGNVGIGTSSPGRPLDVNGSIRFASGGVIEAGGAGGLNTYIGGVEGASGRWAFATNGSERMRIDSSGNLLVGYTSSNGAYKLQVNSQIFATNATIATSDGNYKENITPLDGALSLVSQLNPVQFDWKEHPVHEFDRNQPTIGFIAQEVQQVLAEQPYLNSIVKSNECVLEPEETDDEGNVIKEAVTEPFLGIAEGNMVALLTAAIKEQQATISSLEARIVALETA